ncbi:prephenate dehydrogenase/arogenate dehydrogenase family protein [bacterium]|nr:prephenate dehydrogenase/arogenate dehydrogenase family protein [bacterium]
MKTKIGIIGLGLIGGSLLKKLREYEEFELFAVSGNEKTQKTLKKWGITVSSSLETVKLCKVVFVCSPISKTPEMLDKLENIVSPSAIVSDVASVKEFVGKKKRPYKLIGGHPMAGTEKQGFENSFKELFEGAKWVVCPFHNYTKKDVELLKSIIEKTGARPIEADAKKHDYAVSLISHMPLLISQAIFKSAKDNDLALLLASSGFRDMTRLACSNLEMAKDMVKYNKLNIEKAFDEFATSLNLLTEDYKNQIEEIKEQREKMYSKEGKNIL